MKLTLAYSPCPNDTFMFHGIASGALSMAGYEFEVHLHDIETLNQHALRGTYDLTKLSFYAWLQAGGTYEMLNAGAAMGYGCGPIVVARAAGGGSPDAGAVDASRVAIPGELTTAHLLFRLWAPVAFNKIFMTYDRIVPAVIAGEAEFGVIIHESRFTYEQAGLRKVVDLGDWWERVTGLPVPLAGIAVRRGLDAGIAGQFESLLRAGIAQARANPEPAMRYARRHAQELDDTVLRKHVEMFVNDYSIEADATARAAVEMLKTMAKRVGL